MAEAPNEQKTDTTVDQKAEGFEQIEASALTQDAASQAGATGQESSPAMSLGPLIDVPLRVTVELGSTRMLVREVLQLSRGSVVVLDRVAGDPAEVFVNGRLIARGEVTAVDDKLAIRIVELVGRDGEIPRG